MAMPPASPPTISPPAPATLAGLPADCIDAVCRELNLAQAVALASTCRSLRRAIGRSLPALQAVVCFANSRVDDGGLLRACRAARGHVRVLCIPGCRRLTRAGVVRAVREVGDSLLHLDLSGMSESVINDESLIEMAPSLPSLRVLRVAFLASLTPNAFVDLQKIGFGNQLRTIDISYSPYGFLPVIADFPRLHTIVAAGFEPIIRFFNLAPFNFGPSVGPTCSFRTYVLSPRVNIIFGDVWDYVQADDAESVMRLCHQYWRPLKDALGDKGCATMLKKFRSAWVKSCAWNDHSGTGLKTVSIIVKVQVPVRRKLTTLADHAAQHQASSVARFLVLLCGADPVAGRENSMLTKALLASPEAGSAEVNDYSLSILFMSESRQGLSFVQPVSVVLLVLAAARRNALFLNALCPVPSSAGAGSPVTVKRASVALAAALRAVFNPPSKICFPSASAAEGVWDGCWDEKNAFKSSWLSSTVVHTGANLPNYCVSLPNTGVPPAAEDFLINTGEVVRVLVQRGAAYDEDVALRAAQLGEWHALHVLLLAGTEDITSSMSEGKLLCLARLHAELVAQRLLPQQRNRSMLVAAARCGVSLLAHWTLEGLLDVLLVVEKAIAGPLLSGAQMGLNKHGSVPLSKMIDEDAARAVLMALECGNYTAAHMVLGRRKGALRKLAGCNAYANQALHAVGRAIGRAHAEDTRLLSIGRAIVAAAGVLKMEALNHWLSKELVDASGRTVLHYACGGSVPVFARVLLAMGAAVDAEDDDGATPLCLAVESHASRACLETLLRAGARVDAVDKRSRTALHRAAEGRNAPAAATLLRWGADPLKRDACDIAPAHIDTDLLRRASMYAQRDGEGTLPFDIMK